MHNIIKLLVNWNICNRSPKIRFCSDLLSLWRLDSIDPVYKVCNIWLMYNFWFPPLLQRLKVLLSPEKKSHASPNVCPALETSPELVGLHVLKVNESSGKIKMSTQRCDDAQLALWEVTWGRLHTISALFSIHSPLVFVSDYFYSRK